MDAFRAMSSSNAGGTSASRSGASQGQTGSHAWQSMHSLGSM